MSALERVKAKVNPYASWSADELGKLSASVAISDLREVVALAERVGDLEREVRSVMDDGARTIVELERTKEELQAERDVWRGEARALRAQLDEANALCYGRNGDP